MDGARVDEAATRALRADLTASPAAIGAFDYGPERRAFEALWSDDAQLALNRALERQPLALRNYLKQRVMREVETRAAAGMPAAARDIDALAQHLADALAGGTTAPAAQASQANRT